MKHLLNITHYDYYHNDFAILKDINLSVEKGKINSIIGPNKSGKTTLIKVLSGIAKTEFQFKFDSIVYENNYNKQYLSLTNYYIYSNRLRYSKKTVQESISKWKKKKFPDYKFIEQLLTYFEIDDILNKKIINLNNFDFFKYVLFTLLIKKPKLLLLDGLFDDVSFSEYFKCIQFMKKICKEYQITVIYTTISLDKILLSNKTFFINNGTMELEGNPKEVLEHDNQMSRSGVFIPDMIDLSLKLKFYELIDDVIINPEEMVNKLWN